MSLSPKAKSIYIYNKLQLGISDISSQIKRIYNNATRPCLVLHPQAQHEQRVGHYKTSLDDINTRFYKTVYPRVFLIFD